MLSHATTCTFLLIAASSVVNGEDGLTYTPKNDVTKHSSITLDQLDIKALIDDGDTEGARDIYLNGANREGKTLQQMARKDWVSEGIEDLTDYEAYATLFRPGNGEPYLDSYNVEALNCTGSFDGQSRAMCDISFKKNLLCTGLNYAQYEAVKGIQYKNEKNWDELFAFWNGVYDETIDSRVNSGGPGAVQKSRDSDFKTSFREDSIQAIIDGQKGFSDGFKKDKVEKAFEAFNKANLASFAQATLKYSALFDEEGLEQDKKDKKWGEGYTYFRCGAGLMDPELAIYIDYVLDPRDKADVTLTPKGTFCKIVKKMLSLPEIGMGVKIGDLNLKEYPATSTIESDCDIDSLAHVKAYGKSESQRTFIPFIGFLIVVGTYVGGYYKVKNALKED